MADEVLAAGHCVACDANTPRFGPEEVEGYARRVPDWELREGVALRRRFRFRDFRATMAFVNRIAELAEAEGHHPDLRISYNRLTVDLMTHAIGGLSENDFIMAAKIDALHGATSG